MALVGGLVASVSADAVVAAVMKWGFSLTPSLHMALWFVLPALTFCTLAAVVSSLLKRLLAPSIKPSAIEHWGKWVSYPQNQWITFGISKVADEGGWVASPVVAEVCEDRLFTKW